jgi:hypothetical protein
MAKGEWRQTVEDVAIMLKILGAEHPMTVRQLFYRMVSAGAIENNVSEYGRVSRLITKARRDDRCPYEWIVDRSRPTYAPSVWKDAAEYALTISRSYRKDYWSLQPQHVELWCEKDAVIGSIHEVTDELGITVRVARGYMSATRINDIAEELVSIGKHNTILYIGDHDPSGHSIEAVAYEAVFDRCRKLDADWHSFETKRLASCQETLRCMIFHRCE